MLRRLLLCLVVLGAGATFAAVPAQAQDRPDRARCEPTPCVTRAQADAAQELADKHAPIVFTKEQREDCDTKGEAYYPIAVEEVLDRDDTTLYDDGEPAGTAPGASALYELGEDFYLDMPGNPKQSRCTYEEAFKSFSPAPDPVVYAHITSEDGHDALVLQYWLYFYFNDWNNNHESDWEFLQLVWDGAETPEDALTTAPSRVIYSQHGGGEQADWSDDKVHKEGDRPLVYVAQGSHALSYSPDNHFGKGEQGTGFGCDDATGPSVRFDPEARLIPEEISSADDEFAWITYEGRWGERQGGEFNGPTGPNTKKPWTQPITWMEDQRDSSVTVPDESLGPNAIEAFCGVVAFGSRLLFGVGPIAVIGLIVAVVGTIGVTASRTDFLPVIKAPIARRRKFGQIVRAAFAIERANLPLFLGIGLVFVPLGVISGFVQALVLDSTPVGDVIDLIDVRAIEALAALLLGALQFGFAYWLVTVTTTAALGRMEAREPVHALSAYGITWRYARGLLRARVPALAVVVALGASIVGIPWAILYGTRWLFIEREVLLGGREAKEARQASAELVRGRTLYTFGASAAINATGVLLGPVIGMLLVLLTDVPLGFINVLSSLVYLALIPFVGIAITLLYYDLRERAEGA